MKALISISFLLLFGLTYAQKIEVTAEVSTNTLATNQVFRYIVKANARGQFTLPDFTGFQVLGSSPSQSQQVSIMNGKMTQTIQLSYVVTLRPTKEGTYTIGASKFTYNGKSYSTKPISIKVSKGANNSSINSNKPMFARILTNKSSVYIGEPLITTYKLYSVAQFVDLGEFEVGTFDGFQVKSLFDNKKNITQSSEIINGKRYYTIVINKVLLFPLEAGEKELAPYTVTAVASRGFFNQISDKLISNSKTIHVKSVPNKPKDYNGAVGKFSISADISRTELEEGDAFDLKIKISGKGNIHLIDEPILNLPDDFEVYGDPDIEDKTKVSTDGASGSIEYSYVIRPTTQGDYSLGPFTLSYFNPVTGKFGKAKSDSFNLKVKGGALSKSGTNAKGNKKNVTKTKIESEEDIRHIIKGEETIYSKNAFLYGKTDYWAYLLSPLLICLFFIFIIRKKQNRSEEDIANTNRRKASKMALKVLKTAKTSLQNGDNEKFYEELHLSIIAFLKNKLKLDIAEFDHDKIQHIFKEKGLEDHDAIGIVEILEQCQMARYSPIDQKGNEALVNKAELIINRIQKTIG